MKKVMSIKKLHPVFIILLLFLASVLFICLSHNSIVFVQAANVNLIENKVFSTATLEDNFTDDGIIVQLKI